MSRFLLLSMVCILLIGCTANSPELAKEIVHYEESIKFAGKDTYQLLGLTSKWLKENQGNIEFQEHNRDDDHGIIKAQLKDMNVNLEFSIQFEEVTISCTQADASGTKVSLEDFQTLEERYEKFINWYTSMGIWELPEDAEW